MEKELTEKEKNILERLRKGVKCYFIVYAGRFNPNPYWFIEDNNEKCTIQIKGLEKKGFLPTLKGLGILETII